MTHKLRCETCKFYFRNFSDSTGEIWNKCNIGSCQIDINRGILIDRVGCASHSSAANCSEKKILNTVKTHLDDIIAGELPCGEDKNSLSTVLAIRVFIETLEKYQKSD